MEDRDQILSWIKAEESNIVGFLQDFIRAKSPNPPGNTTESAAVITNLLEKYEAPYRIVAPQPTMPNILGTFEGISEGRHLVLNGHTDVFPVSEDPVKEGWTTDPWGGEIIDGKIYGRGSSDMKCGTSASIWTYIFLNRLRAKIKGKLTLTCVSDEETFGPWGARWLIDNEPEVLGDCCLNGEPSSPFTIRYGEKGLLWLTFTVKTPGAHGAYTHVSPSATRIAAKLINELGNLENLPLNIPQDLLLAQKEAEADFDKGMGSGASKIISKVTLNIGTIKGGLKTNMIPGECTFEADIRLPVGIESEVIMDQIDKILKKYPEVTMDQNKYNSPSHCDPNGEMLGIIQDNVKLLRGYRPAKVVSMGGTDARLWRYKGIPAYVYGPFPTGMGSVDENVPIDDYLHFVKTHALSAYDYLNKN
jgi:succinyl-diaminopimelate desuccinylase